MYILRCADWSPSCWVFYRWQWNNAAGLTKISQTVFLVIEDIFTWKIRSSFVAPNIAINFLKEPSKRLSRNTIIWETAMLYFLNNPFGICVARKSFTKDSIQSANDCWQSGRIVVSRQKHFTGDQTPYLFRSYRHPRRRSLAPLESVLERSPDDNVNYPIWKVARATSAAPSYFKAIKMRGNNEGFKFIDGGFGVNNPSEEVYRSVRQLSNNQPGAVSDFVSIGTGKKNMGGGKDYLLPLRLIREAVKLATESERTHETMQDRSNQEGLRYNRFNVESGLGNIKLDTWKGKRGTKTLELIRRKTNEYLQTPGMRDRIDEVARRLVQIRRSRARQFNSDHWERFCHGVEYGCCAEICRSRNRMPKLDELRQHLQIEHSFTEEKIKSSLEQCKFYPLFEPTAWTHIPFHMSLTLLRIITVLVFSLQQDSRRQTSKILEDQRRDHLYFDRLDFYRQKVFFHGLNLPPTSH